MRAATIATLLLTLALAGACGERQTITGGQAAPAAQTTLTPEQLGELGGQIRRNPDRADDLLAQHGMNRESFEQAVRDVTENPEASRRYAAAYRKAGA